MTKNEKRTLAALGTLAAALVALDKTLATYPPKIRQVDVDRHISDEIPVTAEPIVRPDWMNP